MKEQRFIGMVSSRLLPHGMMVYQVSSSAQWHPVQVLRESGLSNFRYILNEGSYRFKADLYGTSWYHSHYSAQYAGGLLGPMIIYGPTNYDYDIDLGPVLLSDCRH